MRFESFSKLFVQLAVFGLTAFLTWCLCGFILFGIIPQLFYTKCSEVQFFELSLIALTINTLASIYFGYKVVKKVIK